MSDFICKIKKELKNNVDLDYKKGFSRYFKEEVKLHGVRSPFVKKISSLYFKDIKDKKKEEVFSLCEKLLASGYIEEKYIAFDWAFRLRKKYEKSDFYIFERWLDSYVSNWADCDTFCTHAFGSFLYDFPEFIPSIKKWARSENRWVRRASAVILIYSVRKKRHLEDIFVVSDILLEDDDDLVRKGYGWALKEASNNYQKEVFDFVMKRKKEMPRVSLRYAVEKMSTELKRKAVE